MRKLLLFNSHGGQPQVAQIVARALRVEHGMLAVAANWFSWGLPEGLFEPAEIRHGIHGGAVETAMMLALRPDLVDLAAAADFVPVTVADDLDYPRLRALGAAGWAGRRRTSTARARAATPPARRPTPAGRSSTTPRHAWSSCWRSWCGSRCRGWWLIGRGIELDTPRLPGVAQRGGTHGACGGEPSRRAPCW